MISVNHIVYLLQDIIQIDHKLIDQLDISIDRDVINIITDSLSYSESVFNFRQPKLSEDDKKILNRIIDKIENADQNIDKLLSLPQVLPNETIPFLKLIHFFINEHYFKSDKVYDTHGRIMFNSVTEEYKVYLKYPITDVLINAFLFKLNLKSETKKSIIFTCDYDILNIWDALGKFGSFKLLVKRLLYFKWITFFKEAYSFLFSHRWVGANYMLNTGMYYSELEQELKKIPQNIKIERNAFFLVSSTNKKYDIENNFNSQSFKNFLKKIKNEGMQMGLHPSYETINSPELLSLQVQRFKGIFNQDAELCRFHFLHCNYPSCLEMLESAGIKTDYSFYFTEKINVFRGGTTRRFKMWNYNEERSFKVDIIPITIMECTLDQYMCLDYETALKLSQQKLLKAYILGQNICLLWHNTQIYYGKTNTGNYQFKLFSELKKYIAELIND